MNEPCQQVGKLFTSSKKEIINFLQYTIKKTHSWKMGYPYIK